MTSNEFAKTFASTSPEAQERFLKTLKRSLTEEEYTVAVKFLKFYQLMNDINFFEAMEVAVGKSIYEELRK